MKINLPFLPAENPLLFFSGENFRLLWSVFVQSESSFLFCVHVNVPLCKCVFVHISWCICANAYKYLCISLSVFVCVLVFVHLAQGLVRVEAAIIPSNDYY